MRNKINKNLLISFIAPYLLIILIVFVAQYISNSIVMNALKNNVINIVENSFKSNVGVIERNLEKVKETAAIVAQNNEKTLNSIDRSNINFYSALSQTRKELANYYTDSDIIKNICIQSDKRDWLVSLENAYSRRINFYSSTVFSETKSAEELLEASEKALGFSTDNICYHDKNVKTIPFIYSMPILKSRTGSVSIYVDEKSLLMPMNDLLGESRGLLKITDAKGKEISIAGDISIDANVEKNDNRNMYINGKKHYLFSEVGACSKWKYAIFFPESYVLSSIRSYQVLSVAFNIFILVIGFAVCMLFTIKKSRSYTELLDALEIKPEKFGKKKIELKNEYSSLSQHISKIKEENRFLLEKGSQSVLRKTLNGEFEKSEDIRRELKNHKIDIAGAEYGVVSIDYITENLSKETKKQFDSFMFEKICEIIPDARICFIDRNSVAVLFSYNDKNYSQYVRESIVKIHSEIYTRYHIALSMGVGDSVTELSELSNSYKQACNVIKYKFLTGVHDIFFYSELPTDDDYFYPIKTENELFKSVMESNFENARDILRTIQEENFVKRSLSVIAIEELLAELRASIKKICRLQSEYLEFSHKECSVKHFFENAISFIYMLCSEIDAEEEPPTKGKKICKEVKNYIELHYQNPNLSLDMIADEFRLHPNYLSSLFKKYTGSNITVIVENIRIEKAAELLESGRYTVNEISLSVGFTNDSTFRRRFKKIKGVPPSSYLKY